MFKIKQLASEICYMLLLLVQSELVFLKNWDLQARRKDDNGKLETVMMDDSEQKVSLDFWRLWGDLWDTELEVTYSQLI